MQMAGLVEGAERDEFGCIDYSDVCASPLLHQAKREKEEATDHGEEEEEEAPEALDRGEHLMPSTNGFLAYKSLLTAVTNCNEARLPPPKIRSLSPTQDSQAKPHFAPC